MAYADKQLLLLRVEIFYEYPLWFIPFCLLLGVVVAGVLYFKKDIVDEPELSHKRWKKALAVVRFLLVSIIAWLLLSPFVKSTKTESEPPVVLFLQDNSSSVGNEFSETEMKAYLSKIEQLKEQLSENYELVFKTFDSKLSGDSTNFQGKITNLSGSIEEGIDLYKSKNLSAIILASDGIYNNGINPIYKPKLLNYPIYTIALGDTTPKKDILVDRVRYNKIVYLDDRLKIGASIQNKKLSGNTKIKLYKIEKGKQIEIESKDLEIEARTNFIEQDFIIDAKNTGVQHYRISVLPIEGEYSSKNNSKDFFINVLDGRQKILIAALNPHPDIAAIKSLAEENKNYEVDVAILSLNQTFNPEAYSSAILHQIPSKNNKGVHWAKMLDNANVPIWFISGTQSDFSNLNNTQNITKVIQSRNSWNDVGAELNKDFQLFSISEKSRQMYREMPPLKAPFGKYEIGGKAQVLFNQKVGSVATEYPLWALQNLNGKKSAITFGEGLWKWKLYDFLENKNHNAFKEIVNKTLQFLAVKDDKRKFRVIQEKDVFADNEGIRLEAELYNETYQLINEPEVTIIIKNSDEKEYPFTFKKSKQAYELNIPGFGEGNYEYTAKTQWAGKDYSYSGKFSIQATQLEAFQTEANHQILYQLAEETKGGFYEVSNLGQIADNISQDNRIKPSSFDVEENQSILNYKFLFFLILLLLTFEWGMRKYLGAY